MDYSILGRTQLRVSRLAFGAGPVADVMIGDDVHMQRSLVQHAIAAGINWFDTAAGYGSGRAELALGSALASLKSLDQVYIATKVRVLIDQDTDVPAMVRDSLQESSERLQIGHVTLLQLHNAITATRGEEAHSITADDVLRPGGVLTALEDLRDEGLVSFIGLTGIGQPGPLREVIECGRFDTIQVPYSLMNPSAGQSVPADFEESDYGNIIEIAARQHMGVFAIRVFAGGVLAGNLPSSHTLTTKFFPLDLYERDRVRVRLLERLLPPQATVPEYAVRFSLSHPSISSAIIGFSKNAHVDEAVRYMSAGNLDRSELENLRALKYHFVRGLPCPGPADFCN